MKQNFSLHDSQKRGEEGRRETEWEERKKKETFAGKSSIFLWFWKEKKGTSEIGEGDLYHVGCNLCLGSLHGEEVVETSRCLISWRPREDLEWVV